MGTSSGLKTWYLAQCRVKNRSAMINMLSGESLIGVANFSSSTNLQSTGSLLEMSTQILESSLSLNFISSNGMIISIWIRSLCVEMMTSYTISRDFSELVLKVILLCSTKRTMYHGRLVFSDDELSDKELKHIEANDQAIQTILLGLPEDIYAAVDSCETAQEIWLRVQQMMKGSDIGIQEKKAKLFNE
nr:hypothetical protein [Tanacetum cinerariifolium]